MSPTQTGSNSTAPAVLPDPQSDTRTADAKAEDDLQTMERTDQALGDLALEIE